MHRPQWTLHALFGPEHVRLVEVHDLPGHPELADAGRLLAKSIDHDLL